MRYFVFILCFWLFRLNAQNPGYEAAIVSVYEAGVLACEKERYTEAKTHFTGCIRQNPAFFEAYLALGEVYYLEQQYEEALSACKEGQKIRPFDGALYALMGKCYFQLSDYAQAELYLKRSLSIHNASAKENLLLALALKKMTNYKEALHYFDQALRLSPDDAETWAYRGDLFMEINSFTKALPDYERAHKLSPDNAETHIRLAEANFALQENEKAKNFIQSGFDHATHQQRTMLFLLEGNYYREKEDYTSASVSYENAFQLAPNDPVVLTHQAAILIDLEKYELAIEKCNAAIGIAPMQMEAYFNRGIAHEMVRDIPAACSDWQQAFVLGSQQAITFLNSPICNE